MSKIINVELRDRLKKLHSEIYDLLGSEEYANERDRVEELDEDEMSAEEADYCELFRLENLIDFINEVN